MPQLSHLARLSRREHSLLPAAQTCSDVRTGLLHRRLDRASSARGLHCYVLSPVLRAMPVSALRCTANLRPWR